MDTKQGWFQNRISVEGAVSICIRLESWGLSLYSKEWERKTWGNLMDHLVSSMAEEDYSEEELISELKEVADLDHDPEMWMASREGLSGMRECGESRFQFIMSRVPGIVENPVAEGVILYQADGETYGIYIAKPVRKSIR